MNEDEVWGYITKCRQLLVWQLSEAENADLREVLFPALARKALYNRHETLGGRLRDREYEAKLRQVMHIYHTVVMEVCDWMIYNREYFHLLIGTYTTFNAFAEAVDASILDECRGTQSRVWTRKGIVELDEPIQVGTPHSLTTSPSTSASPLQVPSPGVPVALLSSDRLAAQPHLSASSSGPEQKEQKPLLSTPPTTPSSPAPRRESVLFKPEPEIISAAETHPRPSPHSPGPQLQSLDILDSESARSPDPHRRSRAPTVSEPRPLAAPSRSTTAYPATASLPPTRAATPRPGPLAAPRPASPHPGPTPEMATPIYSPSAPTPEDRPTPPLGPTFEIATPFFTPSRRASRVLAPDGPASPIEPLGPTFDLPTPFFVPARPPASPPLDPSLPLAPSFWSPKRTGAHTRPIPNGPAFPLDPLFRYPPRLDPEEPASPDDPLGPTFEVATPFFTYSQALRGELGELGAPRSTSPTLPEPSGPTFPIATPLWNLPSLGAKPAVPGLKVIAPSIASSNDILGDGASLRSEAYIDIPPNETSSPPTTSPASAGFESCPSSTADNVNISAENENLTIFAHKRHDPAQPAELESNAASEPDPGDPPKPAFDPGPAQAKKHDSRPSVASAQSTSASVSDSLKSAAMSRNSSPRSAVCDTSGNPSRTRSGPGTARTPTSPGRSPRSLPHRRPSIIWAEGSGREGGSPHRGPQEPGHHPGPSTSSAPPSSSSTTVPLPAATPRIRPVSSNGSLYQWWRIGRTRRNSVHSQD